MQSAENRVAKIRPASLRCAIRAHPCFAFLAVPGLSDDADKVHHNGIHHCAFEFDSFDDLMNQQQQREISAR